MTGAGPARWPLERVLFTLTATGRPAIYDNGDRAAGRVKEVAV